MTDKRQVLEEASAMKCSHDDTFLTDEESAAACPGDKNHHHHHNKPKSGKKNTHNYAWMKKVYLSYIFCFLILVIVMSFAFIMSTLWTSTDESIHFAVQESAEASLKELRSEVSNRISFVVPLLQYLGEKQISSGIQLDDPHVDYFNDTQALIDEWLPLFKRYSITHIFHNFWDPFYQRWSDFVCGIPAGVDATGLFCGIWINGTFHVAAAVHDDDDESSTVSMRDAVPVLTDPNFGLYEPWLQSMSLLQPEKDDLGMFIPPYLLKNEGVDDLQLSQVFQVPLRFQNNNNSTTTATTKCTSAISGGLSMNWMGESLVNSRRHEESIIYVVDAKTGNLLATTLENVPLWDESITFPGIASDAPLFKTNDTRIDIRISEGTAEATRRYGPLLEQQAASDGQARTMIINDDTTMVSFIHIRSEDTLQNLHWVVFYVVDRSVYYGQAEETREDVLLVLIVVSSVTVLVCILTWLFVRHNLRMIATELQMIADLRLVDQLREPFLGELQGVHSAEVQLAAAVNSFTRYVPRDVVKMLMKKGEICTIAMNRRHCTVLFVDIAGFTTICEQVDMVTLSQLLSGFFDVVGNIVMEHGGVIDKYIGDCAMAIWGAPESIEHAEELAVLCALRIVNACKVKPLSTLFESAGQKLSVRVGVHCGDTLAGNMGCESRMNYTVIGDTVNIAARLEPLCKQFGTSILISDSLFNIVSKSVRCLYLGKAKVVGKDEPVGLYEPFASLPPAIEDANSFLGKLQTQAALLTERSLEASCDFSEHFGEAVEKYVSGEFGEALKLTDMVIEKHGSCPKANKLRERASLAARHKTPDKWSGVFVATEK